MINAVTRTKVAETEIVTTTETTSGTGVRPSPKPSTIRSKQAIPVVKFVEGKFIKNKYNIKFILNIILV